MNLQSLKIISGGQTGADRAGLDWPIKHGISNGGWCPKGRRAEDGPIHAKYQLQETPSRNPLQRTAWNVRDSDGTVIFSIRKHLSGNSSETLEFVIRHRKPDLHQSAAFKDQAASDLAQRLDYHETFTSRPPLCCTRTATPPAGSLRTVYPSCLRTSTRGRSFPPALMWAGALVSRRTSVASESNVS